MIGVYTKPSILTNTNAIAEFHAGRGEGQGVPRSHPGCR